VSVRLAFGLIPGLVAGLLAGFILDLPLGLIVGLVIGLSLGLYAAGGRRVLQHLLLRIMLRPVPSGATRVRALPE
jgi:hypothetical protein